MRSAAAGVNWREWVVTVVGTAADGNALVTLDTYFPPRKGEPL